MGQYNARMKEKRGRGSLLRQTASSLESLWHFYIYTPFVRSCVCVLRSNDCNGSKHTEINKYIFSFYFPHRKGWKCQMQRFKKKKNKKKNKEKFGNFLKKKKKLINMMKRSRHLLFFFLFLLQIFFFIWYFSFGWANHEKWI